MSNLVRINNRVFNLDQMQAVAFDEDKQYLFVSFVGVPDEMVYHPEIAVPLWQAICAQTVPTVPKRSKKP